MCCERFRYQLQRSWTILLALIVGEDVLEAARILRVLHLDALVRTIVGTYFYFGIMLTDLDLTYKWRTYPNARPLAYYRFE